MTNQLTVNIKQAADILKLPAYHIKKLVQSGDLVDVGKNSVGKTKHVAMITVNSIKEFMKEIKNHKHEETPKLPLFREESKPVSGFMTKLERIESKLDKLIKMWS